MSRLTYWLLLRIEHFRTRKTPPARGQVWLGRRENLFIVDVFGDGKVVFTRGLPDRGQNWQTYEAESWAATVHKGRLALCGEWSL